MRLPSCHRPTSAATWPMSYPKNYIVEDAYTITPNLVNQLKYGFTRFFQNIHNATQGVKAWEVGTLGVTNLPGGQAGEEFPGAGVWDHGSIRHCADHLDGQRQLGLDPVDHAQQLCADGQRAVAQGQARLDHGPDLPVAGDQQRQPRDIHWRAAISPSTLTRRPTSQATLAQDDAGHRIFLRQLPAGRGRQGRHQTIRPRPRSVWTT